MSKATVTTSLGAAGAFMMALVPGSYAADPIKVGVVTPLSGSYAPIGKQVRWGAELAVKEINAAGGVKGRPFELLFEDEEANPPVAVRKSEKLLQQDKVDLLTGTVNSGSTLAVGQLAERNNRILVTTVSYAPSITGAQCNPNVFRVNANAFMQSNALTAWLVKNVSGKRYFFIGPDYEMGRSTISAFQDDIKRLGGTDVGATYPPLAAKDYTPYVGQIRAARPDGILSDKLTLAGAAGAVTQENIGAMGGAGEGFLSAAGYSTDIDTAANKKFVAAFKKEFQNDPDLFGADTYGLFFLFKQAIEKAGSTDPDKLRNAMEDASWETPQGTKTIRKGDHQAVVDMVVVKVKGNDFHTVGKVPGAEAVGPDKCDKF
jgi:branched-chain amino acid transport system substrate-binding protein